MLRRNVDTGDAVDPCQPCTLLVNRLGLGPEVFQPGVVPRQARDGRHGPLHRVTSKLKN